MREYGVLYALFLCCGWPLIFHFAVLYIVRGARQRDWNNIRWDEIKLPWSKEQ